MPHLSLPSRQDRRDLRQALVFLTLLGVIAPARGVRGQAPLPPAAGDLSEVKQLVAKANALFQLGEFPQALALYKRAYETRALPSILFNIAQCYRQMNDHEKALFSYRNYLLTAPGAPNRADVEAIITELEELVRKQRETKQKQPHEVAGGAEAPPSVLPRPELSAAARLQSGPEPTPAPVYKRWWFWTVIGVVVAGAAVGGGLGATVKGCPTNATCH
jgi:tetratricopeptide (TPR) repeat protein